MKMLTFLNRKTIINSGNFTILLSVSLMSIVFILMSGISKSDEVDYVLNDDETSHDMLAYVSTENDLILYDPYDRTETTLLSNVNGFVFSRDGRVAYTPVDQVNTNLYVFDSVSPTRAVINISQDYTRNNYPIAWSPDGRYLAFGAYEDSADQILYIWDGETITNIMPEDGLDTVSRFYVDWSYDGRLAFTTLHGWSNLDKNPEIYVWDGNTTLNLSQNPEGSDGNASWSRTGQLMFGSTRDEESGIYVWDGVSFRDGLPDTASFIRLASDFQPERASWTDDGFITFTVRPELSFSGQKEIIVWDFENKEIVQQYLVSSENAWSWLAEGGQMILSSHLASGIPSVYLDVENTEGEILFSAHVGEFSWSSDGFLAYCGIAGGRSFILSVWDGEETWVVDKVSYRPARWIYGQGIFSCNNG